VQEDGRGLISVGMLVEFDDDGRGPYGKTGRRVGGGVGL
jgi:hypothetical protein